MNGFDVVWMRGEHVEAAAALGRECFSIPWSEDGYRAELESGRGICLSALREGELVGFLCASAVLDEAELELVAVAEKCRRRGAAARLLERFLAICRENGIAAVHLEVRASNAGAAALYERFGFVRDGLRKSYYRRPQEDALLYSLHLD